MSDKTADAPLKTVSDKPVWRGVSHQWAFFLSLLGGGTMLALAPPGRAAIAVGIYVASVAGLFGCSALYHRPNWQPGTRAWLRRIDHSAIYTLIAGTYTPVAMLALPESQGQRLLWVAWIGAALGIVKSMAWAHAPKPISAALFVLMGWLVIGEWSSVSAAIGPRGVALLAIGGVCYTSGAVIYAKRKPDPWPKTFGYHEIFHVLVIVAALAHCAMVAGIVWK